MEGKNETEKQKLWLEYFKLFLIWLVASVLIGVLLGFVGVAFHHAVDLAQKLRSANDWIILLLPLAGIAIVGLYRLLSMKGDKGTDAVLDTTLSGEPVHTRIAPLIFIGTVLTHLTGGSAGREGAALQLGGSVAGGISKLFKLNHEQTRVLTMCGMAAAFSALFGTPVTAALFAIGVASVGAVQYAAIMPCMVSALCGYFVAQLCGVPPTRFALAGIPELSIIPLLQTLLMGIACAWMSLLFCKAIHIFGHKARKYIKNDYLRIAAGGALVVAITFLLGTRDYNGAGMDVITRALAGDARPEAFALKLLLTAITIGVGYKGGEIVPSFFVGATFGCVLGGLIGLDPAFGAALGLVGVFCGATNCPIASIMLSVELFGAEALPFFALTVGISYLLSGYDGLYGSQRIMISKWHVSKQEEQA